MKRNTEEPRSISAAVVAHLLKGNREPGTVRAPVRLAVLQADLRGFARATNRLNGELVVGLLHDFFSVMTDLAVANRATIDKLSGNAFVLLFGLPQPGSDDSVRAVRAALEMQRAFLGLRNTWRRDARRRAAAAGLSVGVATGEVAIAAAERPAPSAYTASGAPVTRAAHLCRAARDAEVLIDVATHDAIGPHLDNDVTFGAVEVEGKGAPQSAFRCQLQRPRLHLVPRRPSPGDG